MTARLSAWSIARPGTAREFDLQVGHGEIVALDGLRVACSAALRCLTGTYRPAPGGRVEIDVDGSPVDVVAAPARLLAWLRAHTLSIFDGPLAAPPRAAAVAALARAAHVSDRDARIALDRLGAERLATVPIGRLEEHEAATVGLAAALAKRAPVVVLDLVHGVDARAEEWIAARAGGGDAVLLAGLPAASELEHRTVSITEEQR